jgi:Xaa-Pro aminopeptidase
MSDRHLDRIASVARIAAEAGVDAVVVAPSPDLFYLTGYDPMPLERLTLLIVRPGADPVMLVPALERPLALESPVGTGLEITGWVDGGDPYAMAGEMLPAGGLVAVSARTWASHLLGLQAGAANLSYTSASAVLARLRSIKDADELAALVRAGRGADETFRRICSLPFEGRREEEVAADLAALLVEHGHARADFTIVASGANSASPHHEPGPRAIRAKDVVVMDFGGQLGGYFSDTTRTVVVGEAPSGFVEVYDLVRRAQEAAIAAVRPGVSAQDIDRAARSVIDAGGFAERFFHRTGHGIGLEVHEPPYIVEGNETALEPGMTFSIEPGIYLEGRFGVRIEDIVAVTAGGVDRLNRSTRDLQVVR